MAWAEVLKFKVSSSVLLYNTWHEPLMNEKYRSAYIPWHSQELYKMLPKPATDAKEGPRDVNRCPSHSYTKHKNLQSP